MKSGSVPHQIEIGEFKNYSSTKTNCNIEFEQNKKQVIIHVPGPGPGKDVIRKDIPIPWYQCPRGYHSIDILLKINGIEITGIKVVGVERPTKISDIIGIRARVTNAVAKAFRSQGIDLGAGLTTGSIKVVKVYNDL